MLSTGVEALDSRLGGIEVGGRFVVSGPDGAGKTALGLHFLMAGLQRKERCLLVTAGGGAVLEELGELVGYSPGPISSSPHLRVLNTRSSGESHDIVYRNQPVAVLRRLAREERFSRIVVDDIEELVRCTASPARLIRELDHFLDESGATSYLLASTAVHRSFWSGYLEPVSRSASAVIRLDAAGRGRRALNFVEVRQAAFSTEPFLYALRPGGGFSEDLPSYEREVDGSLRERVVVLDEEGTVPGEVLALLQAERDVDVHTDLSQSLIPLLDARHGMLVLALDPYDPERVFNLMYTVRKSGNGAPIVLLSPSRGLRSATRARALRIGADDFIISELPAADIVARIEATATLGHAGHPGPIPRERPLQPVGQNGEIRPMDAFELAEAMARLGDGTPSPFFAVARLRPAMGAAPDSLWQAARSRLRLADGDLFALLPDGDVVLVLPHVDADLARKVLERLRGAHPALASAEIASLLTHPLQADRLRKWTEAMALGSPEA